MLRIVSWNVLANSYIGYGSYSDTEKAILSSSYRYDQIARIVKQRHAQIIGLQEVESPLYETLKSQLYDYRVFWTQKTKGKPDECALLVRDDLRIDDFQAIDFSDGTGHIAQIATVNGMAFANTHIRYAPTDSHHHAGVAQMRQLIMKLLTIERAVIMADCNDRPDGPVRELFKQYGFEDPIGDRHTARVNGATVSLDIIAARGFTAEVVDTDFDVRIIPDRQCPSDHIPVAVNIK